MEKTFITVARKAGVIDALTPSMKRTVLQEFTEIATQYFQMLQKENLPRKFKPFSIFYYASLAENLERKWNSAELPTLQQEYEMLKLLIKK